MTQSISKEQLKQRRHQLRQQRRTNAMRSLWRFGCMSGILAGVVWVAHQPYWTISSPAQVQIEGNHYLSDSAIRSMLAIRYPQSSIQLEPDKLSAKLLASGSIANVNIDRTLLPPRLTIQLEDRPPVAQIIRDELQPSLSLIDERGVQTPIRNYLVPIQQALPKLRLLLPVQGGGCQGWQYLYTTVIRSPVAIGVVDCRQPQNLRLQTEIGTVRLGNPGDLQKLTSQRRLANQIQQLDQLREWQKYKNPREVDYLDLENPDSIHLKPKQSHSISPKSS